MHDIRTGESLEFWHDNVIDSVAFSPDGRILASWMRAENHLAETDREVEATAQGGSIILERVSIDAR